MGNKNGVQIFLSGCGSSSQYAHRFKFGLPGSGGETRREKKEETFSKLEQDLRAQLTMQSRPTSIFESSNDRNDI